MGVRTLVRFLESDDSELVIEAFDSLVAYARNTEDQELICLLVDRTIRENKDAGWFCKEIEALPGVVDCLLERMESGVDPRKIVEILSCIRTNRAVEELIKIARTHSDATVREFAVRKLRAHMEWAVEKLQDTKE